MRSLDKFYKYLENRETKTIEGETLFAEPATLKTAKNGNGASAMPPQGGESRYVIRNGVTVAVPREAPLAEPEIPAEPLTAEPLAAQPFAGDTTAGDGAAWRSLPENVQRLALLSADLQPDAEPQADERRQLIERLLNPLLTLEDTARLLGVCTATVRRYANKGALPHQRTIGQQRRFLLSDVLTLLDSRKPDEGNEKNEGKR